MTPQELRDRTSAFARDVVNFSGPLLEKLATRDMAGQLRRAATAVSANYRAAGRARSRREFASKVGTVVEEADESLHWLQLMQQCNLAEGEELERLIQEAGELTAIFGKSHQTAKRNAKGRAE